MKLIVAYVRTSKRSAVNQALRAAGLSGWSESIVEGHGRAAQGHAVEHVRVEIAVSDEQVEDAKKLIAQAARSSDDLGDGLIFGIPLDFAERL